MLKRTETAISTRPRFSSSPTSTCEYLYPFVLCCLRHLGVAVVLFCVWTENDWKERVETAGWVDGELDDAAATWTLGANGLLIVGHDFCRYQNGSSSRPLLPLLQEQAVPEVEVQPWCSRIEGISSIIIMLLITDLCTGTSRFASSTWAVSARRSTISRSAAILCRMSTSSSRQKR